VWYIISMRLPIAGEIHCKVYDCILQEQACIQRQIATSARVFDRYIKHGVVPIYLAKCQSGTCEQGNELRMGAKMHTAPFDPTRDFRDQLVVAADSAPLEFRLWRPFSFGYDAEINVQASANHRSVPQHTYDDPYKYTAWEVFIRRDGKIALQVQYLETALVQRLLVDLSNDLDNINLSPLREAP